MYKVLVCNRTYIYRYRNLYISWLMGLHNNPFFFLLQFYSRCTIIPYTEYVCVVYESIFYFLNQALYIQIYFSILSLWLIYPFKFDFFYIYGAQIFFSTFFSLFSIYTQIRILCIVDMRAESKIQEKKHQATDNITEIKV